jgi:transposase-like protein
MKARIALEAIKGQKRIQEIASHYNVHPNQVTTWKKQAVEGAPAHRSRLRKNLISKSQYHRQTDKSVCLLFWCYRFFAPAVG